MFELDNIGCITYCKAKKRKPVRAFLLLDLTLPRVIVKRDAPFMQ
jgi:hypothetical protein